MLSPCTTVTKKQKLTAPMQPLSLSDNNRTIPSLLYDSCRGVKFHLLSRRMMSVLNTGYMLPLLACVDGIEWNIAQIVSKCYCSSLATMLTIYFQNMTMFSNYQGDSENTILVTNQTYVCS